MGSREQRPFLRARGEEEPRTARQRSGRRAAASAGVTGFAGTVFHCFPRPSSKAQLGGFAHTAAGSVCRRRGRWGSRRQPRLWALAPAAQRWEPLSSQPVPPRGLGVARSVRCACAVSASAPLRVLQTFASFVWVTRQVEDKAAISLVIIRNCFLLNFSKWPLERFSKFECPNAFKTYFASPEIKSHSALCLLGETHSARHHTACEMVPPTQV